MASIPTPSALDARTQAFPVLTPAQIDRIRPSGHSRSVHLGDILFEPHDVGVPFFVLLSGSMEIVQPDFDGERPIATHGPGEFTGEITMISGQRCLVRGRVTEPGEFLELSGDALRSLVAKDAEMSEILLRAFILRRLALISHGYGNLILMGSRHSAQTLELREFLGRNGYPYTYVDLDTDKTSQELLDRFDVKASEVPVVICSGRNVMRSPSIQKLANCLGFNASIDDKQVRDVIIAGAGPAGLAAAVYAASEGLDVLVIETTAPGGQAGSSSKIENYLGFPTGVSGLELAARATTQAQKFGARMMIARSVVRLECGRRPYQVVLDGGDALAARAIVIATGAQYNKPRLANLERFEGEGIYYGATYIESQLCEREEIAVVGGGNSAGQAAAFLSQTASKVHMLVRGAELSSTMSRYLIQRLTENPRIELHFNTEIVALEGDTRLEHVTWQDRKTGEVTKRDMRHVFVMTGASPRTEWLRGCLALDDKGFILTGRDLDGMGPGDRNPRWPLARAPQMLETSLPGVFAVGDVRAGNVKRVASAVGEGAISIHLVHRALAEL
ncbi:Cyclic nucleotide-regulated FAD-dependent pyridine nucleotide-disulfide oxidoreductase [Candidatus Sulfopaludibacter sp. SbA4]|nr:Cyclic nucleotide-regulated FAD-dependent pyridine nucleotide-disulfide oxidoreductase [Candidatus Sulfopaludibacter sp. SbA4]